MSVVKSIQFTQLKDRSNNQGTPVPNVHRKKEIGVVNVVTDLMSSTGH